MDSVSKAGQCNTENGWGENEQEGGQWAVHKEAGIWADDGCLLK
jgi:hypothetical protein